LATAELRSLSLYRNGSKAGSIPRPLEQHSTKISGLPLDTEYTFHLVLRTSAGTFSSDKLVVQTHKMTDLSGITVTPGVMAAPLRESLQGTVERIGAKMIDSVRIDTTHFVCTEGRGPQWEKAVEMNVPVVVPDWIKGCEREGRLVGVRGYYLNADPRLRQVGQAGPVSPPANQEAQQQRRGSQPEQPHSPPHSTPRTEVIPPTPEQGRNSNHDADAANGEEKPPPPPPKFGEQGENGVEPKSAGIAEEPKVRKEDVKGNTEDDEDDESEEDSVVDEKAIEAGTPAKADGGAGQSTELPTHSKAFEDDDPPEDDSENFENVAL
jgi:chitin biosynthesis protein CHS5